MQTTLESVHARDCGTCSLCCKVYDVPSVQSVAGVWCQYFKRGTGCSIHATRPQHCRDFFCDWILHPELPDTWKPEIAKFVLTTDPATRNMIVQVDPGARGAWRAEPYYSQIKAWSRLALEQKRSVFVFVNKNLTVVLPDRDVELGQMKPDETVRFRRETRNGRDHIEVWKEQLNAPPPQSFNAFTATMR